MLLAVTSDSIQVPSTIRKYPAAPLRYEVCAWERESSPARSQSRSRTSWSPTLTDFLSIFTPTVLRYFAEKMPCTKRATKLVLPTPKEPSMQIFFWIIVSLPDAPRFSASHCGLLPAD